MPLPINIQLVTSNNNHLQPDIYKYYKHYNYYAIPLELQKYFGKTSTYFVIFHCVEDIQDGSILLNFNQGFRYDFDQYIQYKNIPDNTVFLFVIEKSSNVSLEQIHMIPVTNSFEIGSKHYFLASKLGILTEVVEAGELRRIDNNTFEYNDQSGTFMEFKKNMLIQKKTNIVKYFEKLGEINGVIFKKTNKPLINLHLTIEDIKQFSLTDRVFYDPDSQECSNHNWEIVTKDIIKTTSGTLLQNVLNQHFDEIIQMPEVNKLLCVKHLEESIHYSRPLGNFIKLPTLEYAKDLAIFWPKIISRSEINRHDFEKFINKYKPIIKINETEIRLTVDMFLGPCGNIFKKELPSEIKDSFT
jgi:hypothetical protein